MIFYGLIDYACRNSSRNQGRLRAYIDASLAQLTTQKCLNLYVEVTEKIMLQPTLVLVGSWITGI